MIRSNVSLGDVVKAQVALLFGKYRPAGGLTDDESRAVRAERVEFGDRLLSLVRAIDAPETALVEQVRQVTREVYGDERLRNLPSVESLCTLVKRSFGTKDRPTCLGCAEMGGRYENASPDSPLRPKAQGEIQYGSFGWLCLGHHAAVAWYEHRERFRRAIETVAGCVARFEYPAPVELLPRSARCSSPPADDPKWASWTDGGNMGALAAWSREFVRRVFGHDVGEESAPLDRAPEPERNEEWRNL